MIDIKELRIGNLVSIDGINEGCKNGIYKVFELSSKKLFENKNGCATVTNGRLCDAVEVGCDYLNPILITEEILIKCGFRKLKLEGSDCHFEYAHQKLHSSIFAIYNSDFSIKLDDIAHKFKYLHQLQNIYFDLTREEINVKL